jgi:hypothetical protein
VANSLLFLGPFSDMRRNIEKLGNGMPVLVLEKVRRRSRLERC